MKTPGTYGKCVFAIAIALATAADAKAQSCLYEFRALPQALAPAPYPPYFYVGSFALFDDGTGPAVFAAGTFGGAEGGMVSRGVAKWDGESWHSLNGGVDQWVTKLAVHDDGTGPALYAGGNFAVAGGVSATSIAKWDGQNWYPLKSGVGNFDGWCPWCMYVNSLASFTGPDGISRLYAGGNFTRAGAVAVNYIAQWDGTDWADVGGGMSNSPVTDMEVFNDGSGPALYAIGNFNSAGGVPGTRRIARWNGLAWSSVGGGMTGEWDVIYDIEGFDDGTGPALYAVGKFDYPAATRHLAKWDGQTWTLLGPTFGHHTVTTLGVFDNGNGPTLYLGGTFQVGTYHQTAVTVARWTGTDFAAHVPSLGSYVLDFLPFQDASGPVLFVGGQFRLLDGAPANAIARWSCNDVLFGDMNCDEVIDLEDVPHFAQALVDPRFLFTGCNTHRADLNRDGKEDGRDIDLFVQALVAQ